MITKYITKVRKSKTYNRIIQVLSDYWETEEQAIANIKLGVYTYYVRVNGRDTELDIGVEIVQGKKREFLRTKPDGKELNNLENLPTEYI